MAPTPILLYGATGRMGRAVRGCLTEFPEVSLRACVARSPDDLGCPKGCAWMTPEELFAGGRDALPADCVVIDVSLAAGTARLLDWLERTPRALVSATTGLGGAEEKRIAALAARVPVVRARNLSVGNSVAAAMLRSIPGAARALFEVDLVEHHHGAKRDAPSGTALAWAALLAPGEVRIHSIRSGTVAGIHRVIFAGAGETLEVVHTVSDRAVFARGALRAARFLHGQPPGLYTLEQTLAVP